MENRPGAEEGVTRRKFLAGAGALLATPVFALQHERAAQPEAILHLATRSGRVHSYLSSSQALTELSETAIDQLAALAVHPALPLLYAARDCGLWRNQPRGLIETYAVSGSGLRLLAQTPMALSAIGPRALTVAADGSQLLVSASTGAAWNLFALDAHGLPVCAPLARKETGVLQPDGALLMPAPSAVVFSPISGIAAGIDAGRKQLLLLHATPESLHLCDSAALPQHASAGNAAWTPDGQHLFAAICDLVRAYRVVKQGSGAPRLRLVGEARLPTSVASLAPLPGKWRIGALSLRSRQQDSVLERTCLRQSGLTAEHAWVIPGEPQAMATLNGGVWLATSRKVLYVEPTELGPRLGSAMRAPRAGVFAAAAQMCSS